MKYEVRWWATKKEVWTATDGNEQKMDRVSRSGELRVDTYEEARAQLDFVLDEHDDYDYIETKLLKIKG